MNIFEMLNRAKELPIGDYAECGVYKGQMAAKISTLIPKYCTLWLFDSFKGHAAPTEFDDVKAHPEGRYADTSLREVVDAVPSGVVYKFIPGWIPDSLESAKNKKFRFVHIDLDHYLPTKAACEFFKSRMVPGGIIRFDDYGVGDCPGATKAIDEVFGKENVLTDDYRWEHNPLGGDTHA